MNHPYITPRKTHFVRKFLQKLKVVPHDQYTPMEHPHLDHDLIYPPFFAAFPRGRASHEEMTIQHMYDLFGGGGGGSICYGEGSHEEKEDLK
jgi:hypothetical protein